MEKSHIVRRYLKSGLLQKTFVDNKMASERSRDIVLLKMGFRMLKKIAKILLIIMVVILLDFIVSFAIDYLFGKHTYLNKPFEVYVKHYWFTKGILSLLAVGGTAFFYLFFYTSIVGTKYGQLYKNRGGILVFILMAFCFMGNMIFMFATSFFAVVNFLRVCTSVWLVTFFINKIMENNAAEPENFEK